MQSFPVSPARLLLAVSLLIGGIVVPAPAQERRPRMAGGPSNTHLVSTLDGRKDGAYQVVLEQFLKSRIPKKNHVSKKALPGFDRGFRPRLSRAKGQSRSNNLEIHFGFDATDPTRTARENSLVLAIRGDGRAEAVLFDRDRSTVVAIYKSVLSKKSTDRWAARIRSGISEANNRKRDEVLRESDLFYLSIRVIEGTTQIAGGKVEDMPESVQVLIEDLNRLWRSWSKTNRAAGYLKTKVVNKDEFESLRQRPEIKFAQVETFAPSVRAIITKSINHLDGFHPLTRAQYEQLRTANRLVIHNDSGYVLGLYSSEQSLRPNSKSGS